MGDTASHEVLRAFVAGYLGRDPADVDDIDIDHFLLDNGPNEGDN